MTNPRRPDDVRLSTADLAQAGERANEPRDARESRDAREPREPRSADANVPPRPGQPVPQTQPNQPLPNRPLADRDVTAAHANVVGDAAAAARRTSQTDERPGPLFAGNEADEFRHRWVDVQTGFVDEPRQAVERADALVAAAIKRLAEVFAHERNNLEQQWSRGGDVSTEDLRVALRRYRAFFDRLLSV